MTKGKLTKQTGTTDGMIEGIGELIEVDSVTKKAVTEVSKATIDQRICFTDNVRQLRIVTEDDYTDASILLSYIRSARKLAVEVFAEKIRTPILEPLRKSLDGLYKLERELTKRPFDAAEKAVKAKMAAFNQKRIDSGEELVKAEGSKSGVKRTPVVTDWTKFLAAILAGDVPEGVVMVNEEVMEAYWKVDAGLVSAWPGVTIQETAKVGGQ